MIAQEMVNPRGFDRTDSLRGIPRNSLAAAMEQFRALPGIGAKIVRRLCPCPATGYERRWLASATVEAKRKMVFYLT